MKKYNVYVWDYTLDEYSNFNQMNSFLGEQNGKCICFRCASGYKYVTLLVQLNFIVKTS